MPPKAKAEEAKTDEDPNKVLLKLQVKDGSRACFIDMADTRVSAEQRLMELRLEKLDEECVELRNQRLEYWTAPLKKIHSNLQLPEQHKHVDIVALRKERLAENARAARCDAAHGAVHQHQVLADEMSTLLERVSTVSVLGPMLVDFCDKHADRIARRRCCYLRRVASLCKSVESLEAIAPLLQQRLAETDAEFAVVTESKRTMAHTLPIAIKEEETRENLERMAAGDVKAPEGRKTGNKDAAPKAGVVLPGRTGPEAAAAHQPIPKDMMRLFLRWSTAHVRMQKRVQRFLAKVQWLVCVCVCVCMCVCVCVCVCVCLYIYTHTHTYIHTYIHIYIHTYIYIYIYRCNGSCTLSGTNCCGEQRLFWPIRPSPLARQTRRQRTPWLPAARL